MFGKSFLFDAIIAVLSLFVLGVFFYAVKMLWEEIKDA